MGQEKYLSKYLLKVEYLCPCCGEYPPDFDLENPGQNFRLTFDAFDSIRDFYGGPLNVKGFRCTKHNAKVTDSAISVHPFGLALDISGDVRRLVEIVEKHFSHLRMGIYPRHIHIDIGYLIYPRATVHWCKGIRWYGSY
ncbi:MAG: D-Ala-D-Ala carboxypeptidase family metallohydrolase [Candidatus Hodarchaeota archaeon]